LFTSFDLFDLPLAEREQFGAWHEHAPAHTNRPKTALADELIRRVAAEPQLARGLTDGE
jgi:hypothetical protein